METITTEELDVLVENKFANSINLVHHAYIDIAEDLLAGTLLSQILYWFSPDKSGRPRVRIQKDGYYWLAKDRSDWHNEIRISPKQYDRAAKMLEEKKLIVKAKYKFKGLPTIHIRPNYPILNNAINEWKLAARKEMLEGGKREFPKGKNGEESRSSGDDREQEPLNPLGIDQRVKRELTKGEYGNSSMGNTGIDQTVIPLTEITTELTTESTYIDHHQEIEAAQQEVSATKEQNMVVDVKLDIYIQFQIELSDQEITRLIKHAAKYKKNLSEVIESTKEHFLSINKPINDLMASLMHGITNGWDKPKKTVVGKPLPKSIGEADLSQVQNKQPEESEEDLASTYDDINATMALLRNPEKQVLHQGE